MRIWLGGAVVFVCLEALDRVGARSGGKTVTVALPTPVAVREA
jgi:hypothetical protein